MLSALSSPTFLLNSSMSRRRSHFFCLRLRRKRSPMASSYWVARPRRSTTCREGARASSSRTIAGVGRWSIDRRWQADSLTLHWSMMVSGGGFLSSSMGCMLLLSHRSLNWVLTRASDCMQAAKPRWPPTPILSSVLTHSASGRSSSNEQSVVSWLSRFILCWMIRSLAKFSSRCFLALVSMWSTSSRASRITILVQTRN
mmetsp:Transcript_28202/g.70472  ORF Transcript_28202/g.70472 Transcript_28202/m.70472 type:complete len:200 (-) Transcript_28202:437-1036(-)